MAREGLCASGSARTNRRSLVRAFQYSYCVLGRLLWVSFIQVI